VTRADFGYQLLLIGVAFILFYDVFDWWFTSSDVFGVIWSSRVQSLSDIGRIFSERLMADTGFPLSYFRPIATLTFSLDYALWGLNPAGYFLLHGLVACVLYALLRRFGIRRGVALASSLLFLVHPLHSNTFPSIARRQDMLVALFFGLSWLLLIHSQATGRTSAYMASLLTLLGALWSKEIAYVLPLVHIAYLIWGIPASESGIGRRVLIWGTPYTIMTIVAYGYHQMILGGTQTTLFAMFSPYAFSDVLGWLVYAPTHYSIALRNILYLIALPMILFAPILFVIGHRLTQMLDVNHEALRTVYPLSVIRLMGLLMLWTLLPALLLSVTTTQSPRSMYTSLAPFSALMVIFVAQTGRYLWTAIRRDLLYWWMGLLWSGMMATIAMLLLFSLMIWRVDMPTIRQASYLRHDAYDILLKQADAIQLDRADTRIVNMPVLAPEMD
jgi:hypothetical protein